MATVYKSKIDTWLLIVLLLGMGISLGSLLLALVTQPLAEGWIVMLASGFGFFIPLSLLLTTRYIVENHQVIVICGPLKWRIPLADITNIFPTSNPFSSPALSLDRLRIDYGCGKSVMISPADKEQFLKEIADLRAP